MGTILTLHDPQTARAYYEAGYWRGDTMYALASRHGAQWLVELTAVLSYFAMISEIANAFEVAPPPDGDRLPA